MLLVFKDDPSPDDLLNFMASPEGICRSIYMDGQWMKPEPYQSELLSSSGWTIWVKSRQIGWSFGAAMKAMTRGMLIKGKTSIFISINLDEAKEKIRYLNALEDGLPLKWKRRRIVDNQKEIEWVDGSRCISHPARAARGKPFADIYFDEFAHVRDDKTIYTGTTAATTRGMGNIDIGSTPFGTRGLFHDIFTETFQKYPRYKRYNIPWWWSQYLCTNLIEAAKLAPYMTTEERVALYGTETLKAQFELLGEDGFKQEFECAFLDELSSMFPVELILANTDSLIHYTAVEIKNPRTESELLSARLQLSKALGMMAESLVGEALYAGVDVGRHRDATEVILWEKIGGRRYVRLMFTLLKCEFPLQEWLLDEIVKLPRFGRMCIDTNGLGMQLAESMHKKYSSRCEPITFGLQSKELMATALLKTLQQRTWHLPANRDLQVQLNSIKRVVTPFGNVRYDVDVSGGAHGHQKHHGDKAWALALATIADSEIKFVMGTVDIRGQQTTADSVKMPGPLVKGTKGSLAATEKAWQQAKMRELEGPDD